MIKDAFWITFNVNLDELNQSWISLTHVLQQLPIILQSLVKKERKSKRILFFIINFMFK